MGMTDKERQDWLKKALINLKKIKAQSSCNEKETQRLLIEPMLAWAGYEVWEWKPEELREDYGVKGIKGDEYPDYALMHKGQTYILLEAKQFGEHLDKYLEKLLAYCKLAEIRFGLITDGERWILLDRSWDGDAASEKKVFDLRIEDRIDDKKGYDVLPLFHPSQKTLLEEAIKTTSKVCKGVKDENLREKFIRVALGDVLEKIGIPTGEEKPPVHQEHDSPESVQYWLLPVANTEEESAVDCITRLLGKRVFAIPPKRHLKPGDWIVFYATGIGFVAKARVSGLLDNPPKDTDIGHDCKTIFEVQDVEIFCDNPIYPDEKLRKNLKAFKGKSDQAFKYWYWFVQGTRRITKNDFELLTSWKP